MSQTKAQHGTHQSPVAQPANHFDPTKSHLTNETLQMFLMAPLDGKLLSVPGIGKKHMDQLKEGENGIVSSFQLLGKYLSFKNNMIDRKGHNDAFYQWLGSKGVIDHRHSIVMCMAQKTEQMMPGFFFVMDDYAMGGKMV